MSDENATPDLLELTRGAYEALNGRDFDALVEMFAPTSVWDVSRWGLGTHTGLKAIRNFLHDWFDSLQQYEVQVEEMHALGRGVVLVVVNQLAQQGASRRVLRVRSAPVFVWAEETIALITVYPDVEEGRAAAMRAALPSSQHNIDLHERIVEAVRARRVPAELLAPQFRIESRLTPATDRQYHGAEGLREWEDDLFEAFAGKVDFGVEKVIAASDSFVVVRFTVVGRPLRSSDPVELRWVGVTWFRDEKATRAVGYRDQDDALKAVGLAA
ncbi:MAG TPA: nuclear transport factor 2 family protein [Solirubrobacteraceae bacterium]|jgi:ketosteroid isomerase-like protein